MADLRRFILYLIRWQLSTPILALVLIWLASMNKWVATIIANLIGGAIFFWVDKFIFTSSAVEVWQFKDKGKCDNCGNEESLWRLVLAQNYDKRDAKPVFLCPDCSKSKTEELRAKGVKVSGKK